MAFLSIPRLQTGNTLLLGILGSFSRRACVYTQWHLLSGSTSPEGEHAYTCRASPLRFSDLSDFPGCLPPSPSYCTLPIAALSDGSFSIPVFTDCNSAPSKRQLCWLSLLHVLLHSRPSILIVWYPKYRIINLVSLTIWPQYLDIIYHRTLPIQTYIFNFLFLWVEISLSPGPCLHPWSC